MKKLFKSLLIILTSVVGLIIILNLSSILLFNERINNTDWKFSSGKNYHDCLFFNDIFKVKGFFIYYNGKIQKLIITYTGTSLVLCNTNFTGWSFYSEKGLRKVKY